MPRTHKTAQGRRKLTSVVAGLERSQVATTNASAADNNGLKIGILIVAFNAVTTLRSVLNRIPKEVWDNVSEVAIFDDASSDATYELAIGLKAIVPVANLCVVRHTKNLGYGGNQKAGYQYFIEKKFDVVVLLHGDGQYAPEMLADMYRPIVEGKAEAVFGSRMMPDYGGPLKGGMPLYKYFGNRILSAAENAALGVSLTEFHSGYRAYSLHALAEINMSLMTDDFHFDTEIIIKLIHQRFRISEVPIPTYYGDEICYVNGVKYARDCWRAVRRYYETTRGHRKWPEFAEYAVHYPLKQARGSSHYIIQRLISAGDEVLDVGCGEGFFAASVADRCKRLVGIDSLESPMHRVSMSQYIKANLNKGLEDAAQDLRDQRFDAILLMDVLEHLVDPEKLLADCMDKLKPNGRLIVSVPNVANITVRALLLLGRFDYTERGILDRTHLRFFTGRTAERLLRAGGYRILRTMASVLPFELVLGLDVDHPVLRAVNLAGRTAATVMPGLFGYQLLFECGKSDPVEMTPKALEMAGSYFGLSSMRFEREEVSSSGGS